MRVKNSIKSPVHVELEQLKQLSVDQSIVGKLKSPHIITAPLGGYKRVEQSHISVIYRTASKSVLELVGL
jgi:hypothetical protein